jgi:hypothetical protein
VQRGQSPPLPGVRECHPESPFLPIGERQSDNVVKKIFTCSVMLTGLGVFFADVQGSSAIEVLATAVLMVLTEIVVGLGWSNFESRRS